MKNKSHNHIGILAITGFVTGLLLNAAGALLDNYASIKGPLFQFLDFSFDNLIIRLSPVYLGLIFGFIGFLKMKFTMYCCIEKAVAQVQEAIIIINVNRVVLWANDGFEAIHGYSLAEIKGKDLSDILHGPISHKATGGRMLTKLLNGEAAEGELVIYHKNGEPIWIAASVTPILDNCGDIEGYISINKNITNKKVMELSVDALHKEIADYKYALDQSSGVIIFDLDGKILKANANFCTTNEREESKIVGLHYSLINSSMGDYSIAKPIWNTLDEGQPWKGELMNLTANGKISWADTTIIPVLDDIGNPHHFIQIERNITERKLLESQFKTNNHKLQTALQIGLIGFWQIDLDGIITLSDELRTIIKEPLNSPIDLAYLFDRISPEDVEMIQNNLTLTRTTFQRNDMEFKFLVHGEIHYLATSNTAQFNEDGNFIGLFGTMQDVTSFKLIELALKKSEEEKARAMEITLLGSWGIDINGVVTLSEEIRKIYHMPLEEPFTLSEVYKNIPPDDIEMIEDRLRITRTTFQKNDLEYRYFINEQVHYMTSSITAQFNKKGEFTGIFGTVQDITAFKLIELALKKSEEEKVVILNNTQAIICIHEMDGTIIFINKAAEKTLGYSNDKTTGLNIRSFTNVNEAEIMNEYFRNIHTSDKVSGKIHLVTSTGERRLCLYQNTIYANNGNNPYIISSALDITSIAAKL